MKTSDDQTSGAALRGVAIPSCPLVLSELMSELRRPAISDKRVAALIGRDVGLAAMVVRAANSPLFGGRREIGSITEAIRLLGFGRLTNFVHEGLLRSAVGSCDTALERFWDSSAHTAAVSAELAGRLGGGVDADTAYTFGLFHDCGIPLLVQRFPDYKTILRRANETVDESFTAIEDAALGTNHAVIGHLLTRAWGLPDTVCAAVLCHHDYSVLHDAQGLTDASRTLVALNVVAEHVVGHFLRVRQDAEWIKACEPVAGFFGLSVTELEDLAEDMLYQLDERSNRAPA